MPVRLYSSRISFLSHWSPLFVPDHTLQSAVLSPASPLTWDGFSVFICSPWHFWREAQNCRMSVSLGVSEVSSWLNSHVHFGNGTFSEHGVGASAVSVGPYGDGTWITWSGCCWHSVTNMRLRCLPLWWVDTLWGCDYILRLNMASHRPRHLLTLVLTVLLAGRWFSSSGPCL